MAPCWDDEAPVVLLASGSPRRAGLLGLIGIEPLILGADVDESPRSGEAGRALVERLARDKAEASWSAWSARPEVADRRHGAGGWMVMAADTVVEVNDTVLGKPTGKGDAERMLRMLSGRSHQVHTGVAVGFCRDHRAVIDPVSAVETTDVVMRTLDADTIDWYVETGEPLDKAGAYGIQGKGSVLVERIEGSFPNVVGLPVSTVDRLCRGLGWPLHRLATSSSDRAPVGR
jgi:septum formation protein